MPLLIQRQRFIELQSFVSDKVLDFLNELVLLVGTNQLFTGQFSSWLVDLPLSEPG